MHEVVAEYENDPTTCFKVELMCGTLLSWTVKGDEKIFLSSESVRDGTKAIRGGIPICFPQFGPWSDGRPQHGFARNVLWRLKEQSYSENGDTELTFFVEDNEATRKLWDHKFMLSCKVTMSLNSLVFEASVENTDSKDFDFTFCLHTYFRVDDIANVKIKGLKGVTYVDKTQNGKRVLEENEEVLITEWTDRVYENAPDVLELWKNDKESMTLTKENLQDYVVWNPWLENCQKMSDMDNDGYLHLVCVEAAQASSRKVVKAGEKWNCKQVFQLNEQTHSRI